MIKNIEQLIRKYRGIPFKYGGLTMQGLDCIGFIYRFYTDHGASMPDTFEGLDKENYSNLYMRDRETADKVLIRYFDTFGVEVNSGEIIAGDAIIVRHDRSRHLFPAVYGGNGLAVATFNNREVKAFALGKRLPVVKARRVL